MSADEPVYYTEYGEPVYGDICAVCGCDYAGPDHTPCWHCREVEQEKREKARRAQQRWDAWPRLHRLFNIPRPVIPESSA